jgi:tRNA-specific 2-thiouridylase
VADALDARRVADRLDIPFFSLDFSQDFDRIQDYFADEYLAGRTPNPCVMCNVWLKFGKLWSYGKQVGADLVATGHYARMVPGDDGWPQVARPVDRGKDQSYVLFGLKRSLLPNIRFPVGDYPKSQIRQMARDLGLPVHDKADSQEICFVPDDDYARVVRERRPGHDTSGPLVDDVGRVVGTHRGIETLTIGQRRGLGVALGQPRYVVEIEPWSRTVKLGRREALDRVGLEATQVNWQAPAPSQPMRCFAQIRAQHQAVSSQVEPLSDGRMRVWFDAPQPAVTPGQVVTVYDQNDRVLGGGWIEKGLDSR